MPLIVQPRRRKRSRRRAAERRFAAGVVLVVLVVAILVVVLSQSRRLWLSPSAVALPTPAAFSQASHAVVRNDRPVYPYSIIAGGAFSSAELKAAIEADPVVKTHYVNFDLSKTRVVTLDAPRLAHVSYRVGQSVYWTRRPVLLRAGEKVLTDGQHVARTRCGNQVADSPGIVAADEPAPDLLDTPLAPVPRGLVAVSLPVPRPTVPGTPPTIGGGWSPFPVGFPTGPVLVTPQRSEPSAAPTADPSLQPGAGGGSVGTHSDPSPGGPNGPSNPLPPADVPPPLHTPPTGNPPGDTPGDQPPHVPPDGAPTDDTPPSTPEPPATIPEPSTMLLLGAGASGWLARRRCAR